MTAPRILQEPAEGSRETIEHELARDARRATEKTSPQATSQDVTRILGDAEAHQIVEILALRPTVAELEQAALWKSGQDDVLGNARLKLTGKPARIYEILSAGEEDEDR